MTNAAEAIKTVAMAGPHKHAAHVVEAGAAMAARSIQPSSPTCAHRLVDSASGELNDLTDVSARATSSGERGEAVR